MQAAGQVEDALVGQLIGAQLGDIGFKKPAIVRKYEGAFAYAPPAGRRVIIRALTNCGDSNTLKEVDVWLADPVTLFWWH